MRENATTTTTTGYSLLDRINQPADLRKLSAGQLPALADELRACLIETVAETGGHFAAGLGVVELTVALHYVFDTPHDRLVWDVGHQTYPHKMLTGRRERMATIRQRHGLSGFPRRDESHCDSFGVAHAGTSISAALGMLLGARGAGEDREVVAVIGDGALTAGMALEALNHAGQLQADLPVVLNDNAMSISPNVGGLARHLGRLCGRDADAGDCPHDLFAEFGIAYAGPVDGHDLPALVDALRTLREGRGPRLLHVVTRKGRGYAPAEADPVGYHGVRPFDPQHGLRSAPPAPDKPPSYTQVFGRWLCDMAARDPRLVAVTPAMREGSGLVEFAERFPARYFDAGIAEQHAVTLAAGLACEGMKPVVAIYSTFLQRAYDQLIHDVALQSLDVTFAIDRAGLVGPDGPTHAGAYDLSYLRCIPDMLLMTPSDEHEARRLLCTGYAHPGPAAIRYPRDAGIGGALDRGLQPLPIGKSALRRQGEVVALLVFGILLREAAVAADALNATLIDMRFVCPLDEQAVLDAAENHELLVTLEDNAIAGGAGSAVNEMLAAHGVNVPTANLGLPPRFVEHGTRSELLAECGLHAEGIVRAVQMRLPPHLRSVQTVVEAGR
ncbi:1-deoxy-D-xylulose-5-phosphate synthase [Acidihalobacter ferrooxydans]|uniref:1-deoxy-D-xylulose-5-phosphate synthase n=2 Tax=Acidihalobacter ferrooxydans TaxID=1765967 RepID=A0A1P8UL32_9GAMM|nr:1-deoxy-D-xylulose-5-phosphate synthase [Acidihalobacter ferrooxydans]